MREQEDRQLDDEGGNDHRSFGPVIAFQWNPSRPADAGRRSPVNNFGDLLGPRIVERLLRRRNVDVGPATSGDRRVLLSVGSILHLARSGATVWGSGVNGKAIARPIVSDLDVRAVRGPWTAEVLRSRRVWTPQVFGDPGLLVARLFPEIRPLVRGDRPPLYVGNLNDASAPLPEGFDSIDARAPLDAVLRAIAQSRFVVGTSLHAVVLADSFGVPARFVRSGAEPQFKYRDYLAGTGRPFETIAESVADAVRMGPHRAADVDLDALEAAFPFDLWDAGTAVERENTRDLELSPQDFDSWVSAARVPHPSADVCGILHSLEPDAILGATDDDLADIGRRAVFMAPLVAPLNGYHLHVLNAVHAGDVLTARALALAEARPTAARWRGSRAVPAGTFISVSATLRPSMLPARITAVAPADPAFGEPLPVREFDMNLLQTTRDIEVFAAAAPPDWVGSGARLHVTTADGATASLPIEEDVP